MVETIPLDADFRAGLSEGRDWLWLSGVVAVHAVLLAVMVMGMNRIGALVEPPALIGRLVSSAPSSTLMSPRPMSVAPKPLRPRQAREPVAEPTARQAMRAASMPPSEMASPAHEGSLSSAPSGAASLGASHAQDPITPPHTDAAHLNNPAPTYPALSRRLGEQGRVLFDVYILPDGRVGEIRLRLSSGFSRLDGAAQDAVRRWRYVPARRGSEPIPFWYIQPVTFSLDS